MARISPACDVLLKIGLAGIWENRRLPRMTQRFAILAGHGLANRRQSGWMHYAGLCGEPPVDHIPLAELRAKKKREVAR